MANDDLNKVKQALQNFTEGVKNKNNERDRQSFVDSISKEVIRLFTPFMQEMSRNSRMNKQDIKDVAESVASKINLPAVHVPQITIPPFPEVKVPEPKVTVNIPQIKVPEIRMPEEMQTRGWLSLIGWDKSFYDNPLPVQIRDSKGNPVSLLDGITQAINVSGGGGFRRVRIDNPSTEPVNVTVVSGAGATSAVNISDSSGVGYSGSNPVPVYITSGGSATTASAIVDSSGIQYSGSNPIPVVFGASATQAVNMVDSSGVAYSGSNPAPVTLISGSLTSTGAYLLNGDGLYRDTMPVSGTVVVSSVTATTAVANIDSSGVQYSGSNPFPYTLVTSATATMNVAVTDSGGIQYSGSNPLPVNLISQSLASSASALVDSTGVQYSGSNPVPITWVSGAGVSTAVHITDSGGIGYSGSNPVPVVLVLGSQNSVLSVGPVAGDVADDGSAPVQSGGIARTANPTAVAANDVVKSSYDDLGRQLTRPIQVRDLIITAYATLTNGTETTLLAASAGSYHDLIYVMGANSSDVAVVVDLRAATAGNVVMSVTIPASGTAGVSLPVPMPQFGSDGTGNNWTADMGDITGTSVYLSALFSREV